MKRIVFVLVLIVSLCGCEKAFAPSAGEAAKVYSGEFSVLAKTEDTEIAVIKNGMSISFAVKNPEEIEGLSMVLSGEHATVEFEGMTQEINIGNLPEKAPFLLIDELFETLSDPEDFSLSTENGKIIAVGDGFTAVLSEEDYSVITAVFPQYDTEISFSEWDFSSAG